MDLQVKIEGLDRLQKSSNAVKAEVARQVLIALEASGRKVEADAKRSILQGKKSGKIYKRGGIIHRASAPGEAPANDTGRLANSLATYLVRAQNYAIVTAGRGIARYAALLEFGTRRMAARPFLFPAAERNRQWINERMKKAVRDAIAKTAKR